MYKLITVIFIFIFGLSATAQIKPDTVITATDTLISFYTVKAEFDTLITIHYDTTKTVVIKKVVVPPAAYVRKNLIMDFTVEQPDALTRTGANLYYYWNGFDKAANAQAYAFVRTNAFARSGAWSMQVQLRKTDDDVALSKRAEARRVSNEEPTLKERWYGMSYYLPSDYIKDIAPELLTQWQSLKGVSPPLALWTENGKWEIVRHVLDPSQPNGIRQLPPVVIGDYETEKWTDFVFHVRWSITSNGLIEVWKSGKLVYTYSGANSYQDRITGNYMKLGIYKWAWKKNYPSNTVKRVICADDVRIGNEFSNYNDVAP